MSEWYLKFKLKNARNELQRVETELSNLRIELGRLVDLHAIKSTEITNLSAMMEDMYG